MREIPRDTRDGVALVQLVEVLCKSFSVTLLHHELIFTSIIRDLKCSQFLNCSVLSIEMILFVFDLKCLLINPSAI